MNERDRDMQDDPRTPSVAAAFPADVRSCETWPTPDEVAAMDIRLGVYGWVQQETGCLPGTDEWAVYIRKDPIGAFQTLLLAMANQYEIIMGRPLRWGSEWVRLLRPADVAGYTEACQRAMGVTNATGGTGGEAATGDAGDDGRPTVAPNRRKATRPGTPSSSATVSLASTVGPPT